LGKDESILRLSHELTKWWEEFYETKELIEKIYKSVYDLDVFIVADPRFYDMPLDDDECGLMFPE
jgi:hypothetical protein